MKLTKMYCNRWGLCNQGDYGLVRLETLIHDDGNKNYTKNYINGSIQFMKNPILDDYGHNLGYLGPLSIEVYDFIEIKNGIIKPDKLSFKVLGVILKDTEIKLVKFHTNEQIYEHKYDYDFKYECGYNYIANAIVYN